tara:strand:+ start:5706 stop:6005 length:300 start_codon:yes stop_codon:yes gene_type:complete
LHGWGEETTAGVPLQLRIDQRGEASEFGARRASWLSQVLYVQRWQTPQDFVVGHPWRAVGPVLGSDRCGVECLAGTLEPLRALLVEVRQRALLLTGLLA